MVTTIALFLPNWVGDLVMATPALRAIRERFGPAWIIGIVRPAVAPVLAGTPWVDEHWPYDASAPDGRRQAWRLARRLRGARPRAVILLTSSRRSAMIAWASGARDRIGYARNRRAIFLTARLALPRDGRRWIPHSAVDAYGRLAEAAGGAPPSAALELATTVADEDAADEAYAALGLSPDSHVVVLNPSSAFGPAKLWPAEYFAELGRRIAAELGLDVVVFCGPAERDAARAIAQAASHPRVRSIAGERPSLGLSKALVRRSRLLVTTDSGPRHFAAAFGVPVITLFGPTVIAWSETRYAKAVHLQREVDCGPCQQRACPLGHHRCMRELGVDEVLAAVVAQLRRWPAVLPARRAASR